MTLVDLNGVSHGSRTELYVSLKPGFRHQDGPDRHAAHYSQPLDRTKACTSLWSQLSRSQWKHLIRSRPLFQEERWDRALLVGSGNGEPAAS